MNIAHIQKQIGATNDGIFGEQSKKRLEQALQDGQRTNITKNISLNELLHSQTATRHRIDNTPDGIILQHLIDSAVNLWQPARDFLGVPIVISSGYRSPRLNAKIGGAKNSAHKYGYAIDFVAPNFGSTRAVVQHLAHMFKQKNIAFDQAIIEYPNSPTSWVHLSWKNGKGEQRKQVFTIR